MVDRRFWVADGRRAEFEAAFGADGPWTRLLFEADGYLLTEVWCESPKTRQYRVKDWWDWHRNFEKFRGRFQSECERFEGWIVADGLVERAQFLGAYYEKYSDGNDLVPS